MPMSDAEIEAVTVGGARRLDGPIEIAEYDPDWPRQFDREVLRIRAALGEQALAVEHVGSTAVPGLAAKPIIDIHLVVADAVREEAYAPLLEGAGYRLTIRKPHWFDHRMFKGRKPAVNLHVFSPDCPELVRVRLFRDWLRRSPDDAALYATTKRRLAGMTWAYVQNYADAKQGVIDEIMERARAWVAAQAGLGGDL
jgi:GrpB-like predicted nucleotidyltransferase (UPF0157 family)